MSKHDDLVYLGTLLDTARHACRIAQTIIKDDYDRDENVRMALTYLVRRAGEASLKVPSHTREAHPEVDWTGVADLRQVVDEELQTDAERVWRAVQHDMPLLIEQLLRFTPADPPPAENELTSGSGPLALTVSREELAAFCERWEVRRLAFFGSIVREDFGPDSDVDVLVEFDSGRTPGLDFYGTMPEELSGIVGGRKVDLVTFGSISRWMRANVLAEALTVYDVTRPGAPPI
jgi:hypothetical protein